MKYTADLICDFCGSTTFEVMLLTIIGATREEVHLYCSECDEEQAFLTIRDNQLILVDPDTYKTKTVEDLMYTEGDMEE